MVQFTYIKRTQRILLRPHAVFVQLTEDKVMTSLIPFFDPIRGISMTGLVVKMLLAVVFGGLIGLERGHKHRAAGSRTYMIVCLGAALTMILSQYESWLVTDVWREISDMLGRKVDVSRYAEKVISGIGFLGAGTIILTGRQEIKGLTTAAGLFTSTCMGLAIGSGYYECAILAFFLILFTTVVLEKVSAWVISKARNMYLYIEFEKIEDLGEIINTIKSMDIQIFDVDIQREKQSNGVTVGVVVSARLPKRETHSNVMSRISKFDFVTVVDEI